MKKLISNSITYLNSCDFFLGYLYDYHDEVARKAQNRKHNYYKCFVENKTKT